MSFDSILDALAIPPDSRITQRVPKKLLSDQGARTAADRRYIQDGIEELIWVAALKPVNIGVAAFRDQTREYLEIAILTVQFRDSAKDTRLTELIHRAIPYPVLLVSGHSGKIALSLAHKRWSQGEAGKTVIEEVVSVDASAATPQEFFQTLPLSQQPTRDLYSLYQGWMEKIEALIAARITGRFVPVTSDDLVSLRREALEQYARIEREIIALRAKAEAEKQVSRLAEINLEIRRHNESLADLIKRL